MTFAPPIAALLRQFHAHRPARIWSLIVTLYGDAIVPRGGSLWIGSLIEIMALFGIDAGHVRTAISRLSADGWLTSIKRGRASHYRLSRQGEGEFLAATRRIYSGDPAAYDGALRMIVIGADAARAGDLRRALRELGCAAVAPATFVSVGDIPAALRRRGVHVLRVEADEPARRLAAAAWRLDEAAAAYRAFESRFAALAAHAARARPDPAEALVARTLMIHAFRRIVLRDPSRTPALLPPGWPGDSARRLAAAAYAALAVPSEAFLDAHARNEHGPLPQPSADVASRFSQAVVKY